MTGKVGKLLLLCRWLVESLLLKGTLLGCQWGFCWCLLSVIGVALLFAGDHSVVVVALFAGDCLLLLGLVVVHGIIAVHGIVVFRVFVLPE